jgi:polysaccharide export outer membrane protein
MWWMRGIALAVCAAVLSACSLPSAGPTATQIERGDPSFDVFLVRISPPVVRILGHYQPHGFPPAFRLETYRPTLTLQPGDVVSVSVYETGSSPLFSGAVRSAPATPADTSAVGSTLPAQTIEQDGQILVPFVGRVRIAGKTPSQAADEISRRLSTQTVRPEVIVSVANYNANALTVGGEVNKAGVVPLTLKGEKLLDVIAYAGGPRFPAHQIDVRVIRGTTTATIPLQHVLANPSDNIVMKPSDAVVLVKNPKTFVVLGAAQKVSQYEMQTDRVTLAEGIAQAGGTLDNAGDLAAIYLLRSEPTALARAVVASDEAGADVSYVNTPEPGLLSSSQTRVMYRIDLTKAGGYFFAQNVSLRDKDIVLVANAESAQIQKVLTLLRGFTGMYFDIGRAGSTFVPSN